MKYFLFKTRVQNCFRNKVGCFCLFVCCPWCLVLEIAACFLPFLLSSGFCRWLRCMWWQHFLARVTCYSRRLQSLRQEIRLEQTAELPLHAAKPGSECIDGDSLYIWVVLELCRSGRKIWWLVGCWCWRNQISFSGYGKRAFALAWENLSVAC